jgi:hypothetical protein
MKTRESCRAYILAGYLNKQDAGVPLSSETKQLPASQSCTIVETAAARLILSLQVFINISLSVQDQSTENRIITTNDELGRMREDRIVVYLFHFILSFNTKQIL